MKTKMTAKFHSLKITLLMPAVLLALRLANAQCVTPPSGLVAWWPGEGNANDIAGGNNGTLVGGTTFGAGKVGSAFHFDGTNNYVQIPDSVALKPANLTVEAWVNVNSLFTAGNATTGSEYIVFKRNTRIGQFEGYSLIKYYTGSQHVFSFAVSSASGVQRTTSSVTQVLPGQFYHVVGTYDGSVIRLYVNGVLESTNVANFPLDYGTRPIFIGTSGESFYDGKFSGLIDEVAIFNRALSSNEVAAIYMADSAGKCKLLFTSQPQSQVGYWGKSVAFNVTAGGIPPFSYQWYFGTNQISNATNSSLVLTNLQFTNAGSYYVVGSNSSGSITSNPANLTVNPAGVAIALYPGVKIDGVVGLTYGIQYSTNLDNVNGWIGVTNLTFTQPTEIWYDAIPASLAQRFYRVLQGPIPIP